MSATPEPCVCVGHTHRSTPINRREACYFRGCSCPADATPMSEATRCDLCGTTSTDVVCPACLSGTLAPARFYRCGACQCVWAGFSVCPVCDGVGEPTTVAGTLADDEVSDEDPDVAVAFPPESPTLRPFVPLSHLAPVREPTAEGVAVSEPIAPSPTGTPVVSPRLVPVLVSVGAAAVVALEYAAQSTSGTVSMLCRLGAMAGAAILGIVSPGWRR